ncbi:MAG: DUF1294 domain-containing protein [Opitutales bacterium]|nr:DUF1294 domain-containing protein [Opitutales bacterium]
MNQAKFSVRLLIAVIVLAALPAFAAVKLSGMVDYRLILLYLVFVNLLAYLACTSDKKRALKQERRIPEASLHLLELIGGWLGSFIAQRRVRHKVLKLRYQVVFWMIVIGHQLVYLEYLNDWKLACTAFSQVVQR